MREGFCSKEVFPDICVQGNWMQMIESEFQQEFMSGSLISLNTAMLITLQLLSKFKLKIATSTIKIVF